MVLRVSGKNFDIGESLRTFILEKIESAAAKYFDGRVTGHVIVDHEGFGYRTDCTLHLSSGVTLHSEGFAQEPYPSFEQASERLERRLSRHKKRLKGRHIGNVQKETAQVAEELLSDYVIQGPDGDDLGSDFHPVVVAERTSAMKTMPVSEAVMELDLTGAPVQVFRHAGNGRVNIVYRRPDGNIGWIDPGPADRPAGEARA